MRLRFNPGDTAWKIDYHKETIYGFIVLAVEVFEKEIFCYDYFPNTTCHEQDDLYKTYQQAKTVLQNHIDEGNNEKE